jgi:hypothetical protein
MYDLGRLTGLSAILAENACFNNGSESAITSVLIDVICGIWITVVGTGAEAVEVLRDCDCDSDCDCGCDCECILGIDSVAAEDNS